MNSLHILHVEGLKRLMKSSGITVFLNAELVLIINIIWLVSFNVC